VDVRIFCIVPQVGSISPRSMRPMVDGDTSANRASSLRVVPPSERIFLTTAAASMPATSIRDCVYAIVSRVGALGYACVRPGSPRSGPNDHVEQRPAATEWRETFHYATIRSRIRPLFPVEP